MADADRCAHCGAIIPEGTQGCPNCRPKDSEIIARLEEERTLFKGIIAKLEYDKRQLMNQCKKVTRRRYCRDCDYVAECYGKDNTL